MELLVVMTIVGLFSAMAVVRTTHSTANAEFQRSIDVLKSGDRLLRDHAQRTAKRPTLEFELGTNVVRRTWDKKEAAQAVPIGISRNVRLTRVLTATRDDHAGKRMMHYASDGTSETFAVEVSPARAKPVWLLFAGMTGQVTEFEGEQDVRKALHALRTAGADAR